MPLDPAIFQQLSNVIDRFNGPKHQRTSVQKNSEERYDRPACKKSIFYPPERETIDLHNQWQLYIDDFDWAKKRKYRRVLLTKDK